MNNQEIKADAGKPQLTLVPTQILTDIAYVRMYGVKKYGKKESWKSVEIERYRDAMFRHMLAYLNDPQGVDEESGLPHLSHLACNVAFLCELEHERKSEKKYNDDDYNISADNAQDMYEKAIHYLEGDTKPNDVVNDDYILPVMISKEEHKEKHKRIKEK